MECLPVTEELRFMKYQDGAEYLSEGEESKNEIHGFVFFYPEGKDFA
jgi:hypothetical protein